MVSKMPNLGNGQTRTPGKAAHKVSAIPPYRPFDRLPLELLSHIFGLVLFSYDHVDSFDKFHLPLILQLVSRRFSSVALSTRVVWSYLRITPTTNLAHIEERINTRTGRLTLDVDIFVQCLDNERGKQMMTYIDTCPHRFRSLMVLTKCNVLAKFKAAFVDSDYDVGGGTESFGQYNPSHTHRHHFALQSLPLLQDFQLLYVDLDWTAQLPSSLRSFKHVGSMQFRRLVEPRQVIGSLRPCHMSLRHLSLEGVSLAAMDPLLETPLLLEALESLELHCGFYDAIIMLKSLDVPNLRSLRLKIDTKEISMHSPRMRGLKKQWRTIQFVRLERLVLDPMGLESEWILDFISNLPETLKHFTIDPTIASDVPSARLVEILNDEPRATAFCGRLESLAVYGVPVYDLVPLVKDKCTALKELTVDFHDATLPPDVTWRGMFLYDRLKKALETLREGLDFKVVGVLPNRSDLPRLQTWEEAQKWKKER